MSDSGPEGASETAAEGMRAAPETKERQTDTEVSGHEQQEQERTPEEPEESEQPEQPEQRIAALEEEISDLKDQLLRRHADFENFRKRMAREKEEAITFANQMLLLDLVAVIDDFERAIQSAEGSSDFTAFHGGVVMIEKQMTTMLANKWGLTRYDSEGQPFDPNRHQALATEESPEVKAPIVAEDYQRGYLFHERVLRPARVRVTQPAASEAPGEAEGSKEN